MTALATLDHLVVTAPSLAAGRTWVETRLGVAMQAGGQHVRMGTHNALLRLGPSTYLEVIATDPTLPPPDRPRWFELGRLTPGDEPRLATWVARTDRLDAALAACPIPLGTILEMERGDLRWRIAVPPDGALPGGGLVPGLIAWDGDAHPAARLEDRGCTLASLEAAAGEREIAMAHGVLAALGLERTLELHSGRDLDRPRLTARIATPTGLRTLD